MSLSTSKRFGKQATYALWDYVVCYGYKGACHVIQKVESGINPQGVPYTRYILSDGDGGMVFAGAEELRPADAKDVRRHYADIVKSSSRKKEARIKADFERDTVRDQTKVVLEALTQYGVPPSSPLWDIWRKNPLGAAQVMNGYIYKDGSVRLP